MKQMLINQATNVTSDSVPLAGGKQSFAAFGTFDTGVLELKVKVSDGSYVAVENAKWDSASGAIVKTFDLPPGDYVAELTGAGVSTVLSFDAL